MPSGIIKYCFCSLAAIATIKINLHALDIAKPALTTLPVQLDIVRCRRLRSKWLELVLTDARPVPAGANIHLLYCCNVESDMLFLLARTS